MSVGDHPYRSPQPLRLTWRRLVELALSIEHAFNRARADARPEEDTRVRIFLIQIVFSLVFVALACGATYAAMIKNVPIRAGTSQSPMLNRADVVDRNGALLATSITHYALYIDPSEVWDRDLARRQIRRALPQVSSQRLSKALNGDRRRLVMERLTPQEKARVHQLALGGISFEPQDVRVYPLGDTARHLIGAVNIGGDGRSGAERAFDGEIRRAGAQGLPWQTSIDLRVQGVLESELERAADETKAKGIVGIVTNVQTGEVLALASWPGTSGYNRATSSLYEMGSVFKTFTVAGVLDTGLATIGTELDATEPLMTSDGRRITDYHAQNRVMTLEEVYLHSSNIGTTRLAWMLGADRLQDYLRRFGLLDTAPFEIASAHPIVPRRWDESTLASLSFGYGVSVTPLQAAAAMQALTNGGRFIPLTLRKSDGRAVRGRAVIRPETSRALLDLMRRNVVRGSGTRANAPGLRVGGKTGSANKSVNGRYSTAHALGTFAAVFPADGPVEATRYQILVLVDEPQSYPRTGGFVAAPAVGRIADRIAPFLGVDRRADRWSLADGTPVPQTSGQGQ